MANFRRRRRSKRCELAERSAVTPPQRILLLWQILKGKWQIGSVASRSLPAASNGPSEQQVATVPRKRRGYTLTSLGKDFPGARARHWQRSGGSRMMICVQLARRQSAGKTENFSLLFLRCASTCCCRRRCCCLAQPENNSSHCCSMVRKRAHTLPAPSSRGPPARLPQTNLSLGLLACVVPDVICWRHLLLAPFFQGSLVGRAGRAIVVSLCFSKRTFSLARLYAALHSRAPACCSLAATQRKVCSNVPCITHRCHRFGKELPFCAANYANQSAANRMESRRLVSSR